MENIDIKAILEIIFNYFKTVFAHWFPEESAELEKFVGQLEELK